MALNLKTPESNTVIRFPDCDPFNHLNNSKYLDYFLNERENHLMSAYNFNIYGYAKKVGTSWVVTQNQIAYIRPALLMEKVVINSTVLEWNDNNLLVEMQMWNAAKTKIKSLLWTRFTHYDLLNKKSIKHNDFLNETFVKYENQLKSKVSFEQRVINVKLLNK